MSTQQCPCGTGKSYFNCCKIVHEHHEKAITAEMLMRSRYVGFVYADGDYLLKSHHAKTRPVHEKKEIVKWAKSVNWIKLDVLKTSKGNLEDTDGYVEFKAFFFENNAVQVIHEKSYFIKEKGRWYYYGAV